MAKKLITVTVNGVVHERAVDPRMLLIHFLQNFDSFHQEDGLLRLYINGPVESEQISNGPSSKEI